MKMPVSKQHIPTSSDISYWAHLRGLDLPEIESEVGLLIGNNVPQAYTPCEFVTGPEGSPHATKTALGWLIWNVLRTKEQLTLL